VLRQSWDFEQGAEIAPGRAVLKPIGGGNAYEVLLVWDERLHSISVAKVLRPNRTDSERDLRQLREEAEILETLAHPMIVRLFDPVLEGEHPHLMIEHLEGPSLRRLIRRGGPLPVQQVLPLSLSLAGALHYLEQMEIVHLDVKPDNVIMGVPPRLIDLSIARTHEQARRVRTPIGTDAYMSPEQCDPEGMAGRTGPASDVWGLGATLHHALSGEVPFALQPGASNGDREDPSLRFPQLSIGPAPLPEYLPEALVDLVLGMLAPDPAERPSAAEVAAELEPLVAELPAKLSLSRRRTRGW
jgi:serine/threonine protein kinase